ncbi:hypothetical protein HmCmsJML088_04936 [Escherichia coli]|nr:hypothetical protein HmCmsJML088_04936 [Escherichia coli]
MKFPNLDLRLYWTTFDYAQPFLNHMSMIQAKKSYIQSIQTH